MAELADAQDLKSCGGDIVPVRSRSPAVRDFSLDYFVDKCIILVIDYVCVAQLDRALGYGPRCRGFESSHARKESCLETDRSRDSFFCCSKNNITYKKFNRIYTLCVFSST